jgi:hypothetical protein
VLDITRNSGGLGSLAIALFARLTTQPFSVPPDRILPGTAEVLLYDSIANFASSGSREAWVVQRWRAVADEIHQTYAAGHRGLTGPLATEIELGQSLLLRAPLYEDNFPWLDNARQPIGYDKPVVLLVDDFSASAAEYFAAIFQDNRRGPVVGYRTPGLGGYVGAVGLLPYSQASLQLTGSQTIRKQNVTVPGLPAAPLIEDLGVVPDIELDHQTRANLLNQGRDFVAGFTRVIVEQIRRR